MKRLVLALALFVMLLTRLHADCAIRFIPYGLPYDIPPSGLSSSYGELSSNYSYLSKGASIPAPCPLMYNKEFSLEVQFSSDGSAAHFGGFPQDVTDIVFNTGTQFVNARWQWTPDRTIIYTAKYIDTDTDRFPFIQGVYMQFTWNGKQYGLPNLVAADPHAPGVAYDPFAWTNFLYPSSLSASDPPQIEYDITSSYDYTASSYRPTNLYDNTPPKVFLSIRMRGRHHMQIYSDVTVLTVRTSGARYKDFVAAGYMEYLNRTAPLGYRDLAWTSSNPSVAYVVSGNTNPSDYFTSSGLFPEGFPAGGTNIVHLKAGTTILTVRGFNQYGEPFVFSKTLSFPDLPKTGRSEFVNPYARNVWDFYSNTLQEDFQSYGMVDFSGGYVYLPFPKIDDYQKRTRYIRVTALTDPYPSTTPDGRFFETAPNYCPLTAGQPFTLRYECFNPQGIKINFPPGRIDYWGGYDFVANLTVAWTDDRSEYYEYARVSPDRSYVSHYNELHAYNYREFFFDDEDGPKQPSDNPPPQGRRNFASYGGVKGYHNFPGYRGTYSADQWLFLETDEFFFASQPVTTRITAVHAAMDDHSKLKFLLQATLLGMGSATHYTQVDEPVDEEHRAIKPIGFKNVTWNASHPTEVNGMGYPLFPDAGLFLPRSDVFDYVQPGLAVIEADGYYLSSFSPFVHEQTIDILQPPSMSIQPPLFGTNQVSFFWVEDPLINFSAPSKKFSLDLNFSNESTFPPKYSPFAPIWNIYDTVLFNDNNHTYYYQPNASIDQNGTLFPGKTGLYTLSVTASRRAYGSGGDGVTFYYPISRRVVATVNKPKIFHMASDSIFVSQHRNVNAPVQLDGFSYYLEKPTWNSSNPDVASIDGAGNITALAPGKTSIICNAVGDLGLFTDSFSLYVFPFPSIEIFPKPFHENDHLFVPLNTNPGAYVTINAVLNPTSITFPYEWYTEGSNVLSVQKNPDRLSAADGHHSFLYDFLFTHNTGNSRIFCSVFDPFAHNGERLFTASLPIVVYDEEPQVVIFPVDTLAASIAFPKTGSSRMLSADAVLQGRPYSLKNYTWTSSDPNVAIITPISHNQIRLDAIRRGWATLTFSATGQLGLVSAQLSLFVTDPEEESAPPLPPVFAIGIGENMDKETHVYRSTQNPRLALTVRLPNNLLDMAPVSCKAVPVSDLNLKPDDFFSIHPSSFSLTRKTFFAESQILIDFHERTPLTADIDFDLILSHNDEPDLKDTFRLHLHPLRLQEIDLACLVDGMEVRDSVDLFAARKYTLRVRTIPDEDVVVRWQVQGDDLGHFLADDDDDRTPFPVPINTDSTLSTPNTPDGLYQLPFFSRGVAERSLSGWIFVSANGLKDSLRISIAPFLPDSISWPLMDYTFRYGNETPLPLTPRVHWTQAIPSADINPFYLVRYWQGTLYHTDPVDEYPFTATYKGSPKALFAPLSYDTTICISFKISHSAEGEFAVAAPPLSLRVSTADDRAFSFSLLSDSESESLKTLRLNSTKNLQVKISSPLVNIVPEIIDNNGTSPVARIKNISYSFAGTTERIATITIEPLIPDTSATLRLRFPKPDINPLVRELPLRILPLSVTSLDLHLVDPVNLDKSFVPNSNTDTLTFRVSFTPSNATTKDLAWTIHPPYLASFLEQQEANPLERSIGLTANNTRPDTVRIFVDAPQDPPSDVVRDSFLLFLSPTPNRLNTDAPISSLFFDTPASTSLKVADTLTLRLNLTPAHASPHRIEWRIVPENAAAFISAPDELQRKIRVLRSGLDFSVQANVFDYQADNSTDDTAKQPFSVLPPVDPTGLSVQLLRRVGDTLTFQASLTPGDATDQTVFWKILPPDAAGFIDDQPIDNVDFLNKQRSIVIRNHNIPFSVIAVHTNPNVSDTFEVSPPPIRISLHVADTLRSSLLALPGATVAAGDILYLRADVSGADKRVRWTIKPTTAANFVDNNTSSPIRFLEIYGPVTVIVSSYSQPEFKDSLALPDVYPSQRSLALLDDQGRDHATPPYFPPAYAHLDCKLDPPFFGGRTVNFTAFVQPRNDGAFWNDATKTWVDSFKFSTSQDTTLRVCVPKNKLVTFSVRDDASPAQANFSFTPLNVTSSAISAIQISPEHPTVGDPITLTAGFSMEVVDDQDVRWEAKKPDGTTAFALLFDDRYSAPTRSLVARDTGTFSISAIPLNSAVKPFSTQLTVTGKTISSVKIVNPLDPKNDFAFVKKGDSIRLIVQLAPDNAIIDPADPVWTLNNSVYIDKDRFHRHDNRFFSTVIVKDDNNTIVVYASVAGKANTFTINPKPIQDDFLLTLPADDSTDPDQPETPVDDPIDPEAPSDPIVPETSIDPEVPIDPETPVDPEAPIDPIDPEAPVDPETPVDPPTKGFDTHINTLRHEEPFFVYANSIVSLFNLAGQRVQLTDVTGRILFLADVVDDSQWHFLPLNQGVYILSAFRLNEKTSIFKFIVD
jgi:hypothetical protein